MEHPPFIIREVADRHGVVHFTIHSDTLDGCEAGRRSLLDRVDGDGGCAVVRTPQKLPTGRYIADAVASYILPRGMVHEIVHTTGANP
jgi:hypothetical protein